MAIRRRRLLRRDSGVFILPRFAGAEGGGALATLCIAVREIDWQVIESSSYSLRSIHSSLIPFSQSVISSLKKLRGRSAGRRHCLVSAPRRRAFPLVGVRGAGAPYGRARLPALRRGTCGSERTPPLSFSPHFLGPGVIRCYLHLACPFSPASCPAVPVIVPDGRIRRSRPGAGYEAARGNRTRSVSGIVSRNALTRASHYSVTEAETHVNVKVTAVTSAFLPRVRIRKIVAALTPPANGIIQML